MNKSSFVLTRLAFSDPPRDVLGARMMLALRRWRAASGLGWRYPRR